MSNSLRALVLSLFVVMSFAVATSRVTAREDDTGTVRVLIYSCSYLDLTLQVEAIDVDECTPAEATLTFYLVGDGTADYEQLVLDGGGDGSITLAAGTYEMIEEGTQARFTLTVVAGQTTQMLIGTPPVEAPAPAPKPTAAPTAVPGSGTPVKLPNTGDGDVASGRSGTAFVLGVAAFVSAWAGLVVLQRASAD